jgi:hypothetical protein
MYSRSVRVFIQFFEIVLLLAVLAFQILSQVITSYAKKKAENVATKEDVGAITTAIEKAKLDFSVQLEQLKSELDATNRLRLAAADKRLEKHQEAYKLCIELEWNLHDRDALHKTILECQAWWIANCLYLTTDARTTFKFAYDVADGAWDDAREQRKVRDDIGKAMGAIIRGCGLPSLGQQESKHIAAVK